MENILEVIRQGIMEGDMSLTEEKVQEALDAGVAPGDILQEGLIAAMAEVGRLFEEGEYFVPEMLIAARAMKAGMVLLKPYLVAADVKPAGKVAAGTVKGDLHDIGKNLVCMMLEGAGFEILDLGVDVTPEKFVDAAANQGVDIIAMSALLTTTMPNMKATVEALKAAGVRDKVKVMIGGAPVTDAYAAEIGADGYGADASRAVAAAKHLMGIA
ncbi:MAG TPA: corrinoid protein [Anaerolineae bacterium]|nr:corrinoid protein [Anaerolineae bacterium]